jgi:hypothetical protein
LFSFSSDCLLPWTSLSNKYQKEQSENVVIKKSLRVFSSAFPSALDILSNKHQEERHKMSSLKKFAGFSSALPSALDFSKQ